MKDVALSALRSVERLDGVEYADIRLRRESQRALVARDGELIAPLYQQPRGLMLRVLHAGRWGYASTTLWEDADWESLAEEAIGIARAAALIPGPEVELVPIDAARAERPRTFERDPIAVPIDEQRAALETLHRVLRSERRICETYARLDGVLREEIFASTEGAWIEGTEAICGLHFTAAACEGELVQRRSSPYRFERRGWELIAGLDLELEAGRLVDALLPLLDAAPCPETTADVILTPSALGPLTYETLGAALELDRVLIGESPFSPEDKGALRITEGPLTLALDPGASHLGLGTYDADDEGVLADDADLIIDGRLVRFISDREHASRVSGHQPPGALRASGLNEVPLIRCPALRMARGHLDLNALRAAAPGGYVLDGALEWELDPARGEIRLRAESATRITEDGGVGELLRDPVLTAETLDLWTRLEAVGSERRRSAIPWTTKGAPPQTAGVTVEAPHALFRQIRLESAG